MRLRVVLAGLGRVGRGILRANYDGDRKGRYDIIGLRDVMSINHLAYLLQNDSTYGPFRGTIDIDGTDLVINDQRVRYFRVDRRRDVHWDKSYADLAAAGQVDVFIEATGTASEAELRWLVKHRIARKVLSTWDVAGCDVSIVKGVNDKDYDHVKHEIVSSSTCTGNAASPVLSLINDAYGVEFGRIITVHPALADQRVLDGYHEAPHLGRTCAASIIPTSTQVGRSAARIVPSLQNKLQSISYRIPTAIVSGMDMFIRTSKPTDTEQLKKLFEDAAKGPLKGIMLCDNGAWGAQRVSIDYLASPYSAIVLMNYLLVTDGYNIGVSLMHDNEWGYCCRSLDVLGLIERGAREH